jgi:hypothetical protein
MKMQHSTWDVRTPAGSLCVIGGEYRSEDRPVRGIGRDGYSRFVTLHIDINYSSAPFQSCKVDSELRAYVLKTLPRHLYVIDGLADTDRTDPL